VAIPELVRGVGVAYGGRTRNLRMQVGSARPADEVGDVRRPSRDVVGYDRAVRASLFAAR
jgi:hypothetical protein